MTAHCSVETFSAYLDRELPNRRAREVEEHVRDCDACRAELASLERLTGRLRGLERMAPPSTLGLAVERRVALGARRRRRWPAWPGTREGEAIQPSIQVVFALVVAFGAILLLFGDAVERGRRATIPVSLHAPAGSTSEAERPSPEVVERAGRRLTLIDGTWWQEATAGRTVDRSIVVGSAEWEREVAGSPALGQLAELLPAVVEIDGAVVRLEPAAARQVR